MKLAVVAMVRNETDIIGTFLQHLDALFDYAVLMDHGSIDGTDRMIAAVCASRPGWTMWHLDPVGYHQVAFGRFALRHLMLNTDADAVVFMDADEFIDVSGRAPLEAAIATLTDADRIGHFRWRNVVPERLDARVIRPQEAIWRSPGLSPNGKVVVPRPFYARHAHEAHLAIGNHGMYYDPERIVPSNHVGEILHLPVRSHTQIKGKVLAGVFSTMAQAVRLAAQNRHWFDILYRIADNTLRDEDLIGIAAHYGQVDGTTPSLSRAELVVAGYTATALAVAFGRDLAGAAEPTWIDPVRLVASILRNYRVEDARDSELVLEGDRLRFVPKTAPNGGSAA